MDLSAELDASPQEHPSAEITPRPPFPDADTLAVDPARLDELLSLILPLRRDWPPGHAIAVAPEVADSELFNAGVMLLRPDAGTHGALLAAQPATRSYNRGDQGLLNAFFNPEGLGKPPEPGRTWLKLPQRYNVPTTAHERHAWNVLAPQAVVLHFTSETKPWNFHRRGSRGSMPWRAALDLSAWWLWKMRSFATRRELGILDYGQDRGLSSRAKHLPGRSRCLAAFEGIFGDVLRVSTEAVAEYRGWPPVMRGGDGESAKRPDGQQQ
ncbi:hypothetical protein DFJ74DRAFT_775099 [Hyaloraphidium curvatum]|nr:hypothetical protein DFJ74DRAFT_775099 [Hyaloraphidium curvatum]